MQSNNTYNVSVFQVPFGEVTVVKNWLGISDVVFKPNPEHPKRPVYGFDCPRSEVPALQFHALFISDAIFDSFMTSVAGYKDYL